MPWDSPQPSGVPLPASMPAESMSPDIAVVATNATTGQRVDVSPALREAIQTSVNDLVATHPVVVKAARAVAGRDFSDRTMMGGSVIDITVATVAALSTIISPNSTFTTAAWAVAAVLAAKTLITAVVNFITQDAV